MSLKKEMFIAISLGLILGGGAALLFAQIPQNLIASLNKKAHPKPSSKIQPSPSPTPIPNKDLTIEILFPTQQSFVDSDKINVSGKTKPNTTVIVTSGVDEVVTTSDKDGTFSAPIKLAEGANEILAASISGEKQAEQTVVVNYTPETL